MSLRGLNRLSLPTASFNDGNGTAGKEPPPSKPNIASYFNESNIHKDIKITFTLPSGELFEETVKDGETVQEIKRRLYSASKIPSNSMFYLNGNAMLDPLSLNDIPGVVGHSSLQVEVKVKGQTTPADVTKRETTTSGTDAQPSNSIPPSTTPPSTSSSLPPISPPVTAKYEQSDKSTLDVHKPNQPPNTSTSDTCIDKPENKEHMYNIGNGKDERSAPSTTSHGTDEHDVESKKGNDLDIYSKKGNDPPPDTKHLNFVEPASTSSTSSPDSNSTIPSLPHAAFDEGEPTTTPKPAMAMNEKSKSESETAIDVTDEREGGQKQIQTLGGGKRWFCQVV